MPDSDSNSLLPAGLRWAGPLLAPCYGLGVAIHRSLSKKSFAPIATICVGNLTVGGTGKTPAVIFLARELARRGRKPAILMRGYKAQGSDEAAEVQTALQGLDIPILLGADRRKSALLAREAGRDIVLLDDGFQHWRLARDLDIVLIDATNPFGGSAIIPHGRLREPLSEISRAGVLLLTRSSIIEQTQRTELKKTLSELAPKSEIIFSDHVPTNLRNLNSDNAPLELSALRGQRIIAACGIGNPAAFQRTLVNCGADILESKNFADHHDYSQQDIESLARMGLEKNASAIVVTEKDAVKIQRLKLPPKSAFLALKIEFQIADPGNLWSQIEKALVAGDARSISPAR